MGGAKDPEDPVGFLYRRALLVFRVAVILLVAAVLLVVASISSLAYSIDFVSREVDPASVTCCPSVCEGSEGSLQMAYATSEGLMFLSESGGDQSVEPVIPAEYMGYGLSFKALALAVDSSGWAHIASVSKWYDGPTSVSKLVYSEDSSSGWVNTVLDEDVAVLRVSIAVDSQGGAHVAYSHIVPRDYTVNLTYATDSSGEWKEYDLQDSLTNKWVDWVGPSIVVDSTDVPHIAALAGYELCYFTNLTGNVEFMDLDWGNAGAGDVGPSFPAVLASSDGAVHVLYLSTYQERYDTSALKWVSHFIVSDGSYSFANASIDTVVNTYQMQVSAATDSSGAMMLYAWRSSGLYRVCFSDDGTAARLDSVSVLSADDDGFWPPSISVALLDGGATVIARPYGAAGYLTDSMSVGDRLSGSVALQQNALIVSALVIVALSVFVLLSHSGLVEARKWYKAGLK